MGQKLARSFAEIRGMLRRNSLNFVIIAIWSIVVAAFVIHEYLAFWYSRPEFVRFITGGAAAPPFQVWQGAGLKPLSVVILSGVSLVCGILIVDIDKVLFGSLGACIISFLISSVYIGNFIWTVGGWGKVLSITEAGWSWALYWGILNTFREVFPIILLAVVICGLLGAFLRALVYP